nr:DNA-binding domain-containing protein [Hylemonella gracilis]
MAREDVPVGTPTSPGASFSVQAEAPANSTEAPPLQQLQLGLASYILGDGATDSAPVSDWIRTPPGVDAGQRLGIYHNAYRARLAEVLAESFARTVLYMGSDRFEQDARAFAVSHPPMVRNLAHYGADFAAFLAALYPGNPELQELAQLDWDLRTTFDEADAPALDTQTAGAQEAALWLNRAQPLHPSLKLRSIRTNVAQIWHAIDRDLEVPAVAHREEPGTLLVWRKGLLPHFQTLEPDQAAFMLSLAQGRSIEATCADLAGTAVLPDPQRLAGWLQVWLEEGWLRAA